MDRSEPIRRRVPQGEVGALAARLTGQVFEPGSPGYDDHRRSFNAMVDRRPALIAACAGVDDIVAALAFGRAHELPIGVRGGGHSVAGHGVVHEGLVIDLRRMRGVSIDPGGRTAAVEGGASWLDFDTAAQRHGLAVTGGTFADTGVAGLTLGGGIGFLMGTCGLTCDNLVGAQLVTAEGTLVEVTEATDPDLLWALRGGGGNFGIATRLDFVLTPVGTIFGGSVFVPISDGAVLARLATVQRDAPDSFVAIAYAVNHPEFGPGLSIDVASLGDERSTRELCDAIIGGSPLLDGELRALSYADVQAFNAVMPFTLRHYWKSAFVPELSSAVIDSIVDHVSRQAIGKTGVLLEPLHGAARQFGFEHAAFPQREARYHVSALGIWEDPADDDRAIAWVRELHRQVTEAGTSGTYVNYIAPDEPADRARSAYPPGVLARLRQVKRRVDPRNVFRSNLNITPTD